jgi:hypothetical protein
MLILLEAVVVDTADLIIQDLRHQEDLVVVVTVV